MFKMTKGRKRDLVTIEFFIPKHLDGDLLHDSEAVEHPDGVSPEQAFFEHSDMGIPMAGRKVCGRGRLELLLAGKEWRGVHTDIWERGILDGSMPFIVLMGIYENCLVPIEVVNFMKRDMFKGKHAKVIENAYEIAKKYHRDKKET